MTDTFRDAAADLRYLLSKGYKRSSAVRFVADRYGIGKTERLALYRCVYPREVADSHFRKIVPAENLSGAALSVDGFNVLRTVFGAMRGHPIYLCDDGFVRDISIGRRNPAIEELCKCLDLVISCICTLKPRFTVFVYDRPISRSGDLSKRTLEAMGTKGLAGESRTSARPDSEVLSCGDVVATSDSAMIERALRVFDLGGYIVTSRLGALPTKI
ncbi:MAG: DUF434 domain-containing protein [Candidatus Methanosuratus sp.]|nr:DUF434 domain-containing protein [Candidatus Methanosuratincola sp.]